MIETYHEPVELKGKQKPIQYEVNERGCWNVTSHSTKYGYADIYRDKVRWRSHRLVYTYEFGEIPEGMVVRHKCDNPKCINPEHLEIGTPQDNVNDMVVRGRNARGEKHGRAKLTQEQVEKIREDSRPSRAVAKDYGVTHKIILNIRNGVCWND